ncbi:hypothetical protein CATRI_10765 [Corynebacterium atrinae]|nr:hypothetical protein CATRI_10765 [Corynebacterium atrinae]
MWSVVRLAVLPCSEFSPVATVNDTILCGLWAQPALYIVVTPMKLPGCEHKQAHMLTLPPQALIAPEQHRWDFRCSRAFALPCRYQIVTNWGGCDVVGLVVLIGLPSASSRRPDRDRNRFPDLKPQVTLGGGRKNSLKPALPNNSGVNPPSKPAKLLGSAGFADSVGRPAHRLRTVARCPGARPKLEQTQLAP